LGRPGFQPLQKPAHALPNLNQRNEVALVERIALLASAENPIIESHQPLAGSRRFKSFCPH